MTNEPVILTCVDAIGRLFRRSMYLHADDQKWYSHPQKKVNPLEKWKFWSEHEHVAQKAAAVVRKHLRLVKELEDELMALKAEEQA